MRKIKIVLLRTRLCMLNVHSACRGPRVENKICPYCVLCIAIPRGQVVGTWATLEAPAVFSRLPGDDGEVLVDLGGRGSCGRSLYRTAITAYLALHAGHAPDIEIQSIELLSDRTVVCAEFLGAMRTPSADPDKGERLGNPNRSTVTVQMCTTGWNGVVKENNRC